MREKIIIAFVLILTTILSLLNLDFYVDDGLIYGRYIENFHQGLGLVYNQNEVYNALTSPLFTYLTLLINVAIDDTILSLNLLSSISMLMLVIFSYSSLSIIGQKYAGIIMALLVSLSPYFYQLFTMETQLYSLLILMSWYFYVKNKYYALSVTLGLLLMTRSEGLFLIISIVIHSIFWRRYFPKWSELIPGILVVFAVASTNYYFFDEFIASTGSAKVYHGESGYWKVGIWFPLHFIRVCFDNGISLVLFLLGILGLFDKGLNGLRIILFSFMFFLLLFYMGLKIPAYQWYFAPIVLLLYFTSSLGCIAVWRKVKTYGFIKKSTILIVLFACVVIPVFKEFHLGRGNGHYYKDAGLWLRQNTDERAKIAMYEIGIVGFYSERYIIDILGLVSAGNAEFVASNNMVGWMNNYDADYLILHEPIWQMEQNLHDELKSVDRLIPVNNFDINGLRLYKIVSNPIKGERL